jgi:hypothetical protein
VRTTLTIDDDVAALLAKENRRANEPMKQTVNRVLRSGLAHTANPPRPRRFIVKPLDLGTTPEQWERWSTMKLDDILDEAEGTFTR